MSPFFSFIRSAVLIGALVCWELLAAQVRAQMTEAETDAYLQDIYVTLLREQVRILSPAAPTSRSEHLATLCQRAEAPGILDRMKLLSEVISSCQDLTMACHADREGLSTLEEERRSLAEQLMRPAAAATLLWDAYPTTPSWLQHVVQTDCKVVLDQDQFIPRGAGKSGAERQERSEPQTSSPAEKLTSSSSPSQKPQRKLGTYQVAQRTRLLRGPQADAAAIISIGPGNQGQCDPAPRKRLGPHRIQKAWPRARLSAVEGSATDRRKEMR